jgi:hypothetical protein
VGYSPRPAAAPQSQPSAKLEPFVAQPINDAGPSHNRGGLRFPAEPRRASDFRVPNNMDRVLARSRTHSGYPRSFFGGGNQP